MSGGDVHVEAKTEGKGQSVAIYAPEPRWHFWIGIIAMVVAVLSAVLVLDSVHSTLGADNGPGYYGHVEHERQRPER